MSSVFRLFVAVPTGRRMSYVVSATAIEWLLKRVERSSAPNGCWEWIGPKDADGYGRVSIGGKRIRAHRLFWELSRKRRVPRGLFICHNCRNTSCVRPSHLRADTHEGNSADEKGRQQGSKLTARDVLLIRQQVDSGSTHRATAVAFGVSKATVTAIVLRRTWSSM